MDLFDGFVNPSQQPSYLIDGQGVELSDGTSHRNLIDYYTDLRLSGRLTEQSVTELLPPYGMLHVKYNGEPQRAYIDVVKVLRELPDSYSSSAPELFKCVGVLNGKVLSFPFFRGHRNRWAGLADNLPPGFELLDRVSLPDIKEVTPYHYLAPGGTCPLGELMTLFGQLVDEPLNTSSPEEGLPLLLSSRWHGPLHFVQPESEPIEGLYQPSGVNYNVELLSTDRIVYLPSSEQLELADVFLRMIKEERRGHPSYRLDIGRVFHKLYRGEEAGIDDWMRWCPASSTFDFGKAWESFDSYNPFDLHALEYMARSDSREEYDEWLYQRLTPMIAECIKQPDHTTVTSCLYQYLHLDFVYVPEMGKWFQYQGDRWHMQLTPLELRRRISKDFAGLFEAYQNDLTRSVMAAQTPGDKAVMQGLLKGVGSLIGKLHSASFKNSLMQEATEHFYSLNFEKYMDKNPDLMGVENGVLECIGDKISFRRGKPHDYITLSATVPFKTELTWDDPQVKEFMNWMNQCFPDPELCHHVLKFMASCIRSLNTDKKFTMFCGLGDNSKSMLIKLMNIVFGTYAFTFSLEYFTTRSKDKGKPNPELVMARHAKIAWIVEPGNGDTLDVAAAKVNTGGDDQFARLLRENGGIIKIMFKLIAVCNKIPIMPDADQAMRNRLLVFPFLSTWVEKGKAPSNLQEQFSQRLFPMDKDFESKLPQMAPAALWVLVNMYHHFKQEGLSELPRAVVDHTQRYWEANDIFGVFIRDKIEDAFDPRTGRINPNELLHITNVIPTFNPWHVTNYPSLRLPNRDLLQYELEQRFGQMPPGGWPGKRMKQG